jgi:hypothetical protein
MLLIWRILFQMLRKSKIILPSIMTTVVIIALAYTLFLQTVLLQDNLDITSNIAALGCYAMQDARDLENEEGDTTVVVWAPALGVDKPE